jgi:hypothetical protein
MSYNADSDGYNENEDKLNQDFKQITVSASIYTEWSILE